MRGHILVVDDNPIDLKLTWGYIVKPIDLKRFAEQIAEFLR